DAVSEVEFGNAYARARPVSITLRGTRLTVEVPRLATDGPLTLLTPDGRRHENPAIGFSAWSYRNRNGYMFENFDRTDVDFDEVEELFGYDETHIGIDLPLVGRVTTPIPDPFAIALVWVAERALDGGQCVGMSLSSLRFLHGDRSYDDFPLAGPDRTV